MIDVRVTPKEIIRLGKANPEKIRPIKLVLNPGEKQKIMENLGKLKHADQEYKKLSIRDDYTIKQRDLIRRYSDEAKQKNLMENTTAWKVRGTPKKGLYLVQVTRD